MHQETHDSERLRAIIETAIDGIITIDDRGIIDTVNPAAARLFEYEPDEMIGNNVSMLMPEPHRAQHDGYIGNYLSSGEGKIIGVGREVMGQKKSGNTFPFRLAVGEVTFKDGKRLFTGIIHDLTQQKAQEERLRQYAAELKRSNEDLENFAYVSSHDLQEPLRKIQAFGSRIEAREGDKLSEQGLDYLRRMQSASARLQALINDLLTFSRVATRARPFTRENLSELLHEVLLDLELAIQETEAVIEMNSLPFVEVDAMQIRQLFQNLVSNALKFRQEGTTPHIRISAEPTKLGKGEETSRQGVKISFQDNGIGFEEKYIDRIFNIFQRLQGRKYQGSGIGLAICRKIALRHGGNITATSQPGQGATFTVVLPLSQIAPPE